MRDRNQGRQHQQEQSNERNSQNLGYEQTSNSQQQQRGIEQTPERGRSGIAEPTKRSGSEKDRLSESESV